MYVLLHYQFLERVKVMEQDRYCVLGVLVDIANKDAEKFRYKRTLRIRIRNIRERVGIRIGSFIAGFDLTPHDSYDCY